VSAGNNHWVRITDDLGTVVEIPITLSLSPQLDVIRFNVDHPSNAFCNDGSIQIRVFNGTSFSGGQFKYYWDDDEFGEFNVRDRSGLADGLYKLTVYDSVGCSASIEVALSCTHRPIPAVYISPNDDNFNDFWEIKYIERFPDNTVTIFNSYGEQVRAIKNYNNEDNRWDGTNEKGQLLPDGTYYYVIEARNLSPMTGWVLMKGSKSK
jgi:gliding motility-associated-like protein